MTPTASRTRYAILVTCDWHCFGDTTTVSLYVNAGDLQKYFSFYKTVEIIKPCALSDSNILS